MKLSFLLAMMIAFSGAFSHADVPKSEGAAQEKAVKDLKKHQREHLRAINLALAGNTKRALSVLEKLAPGMTNEDERDRVYISIARIQYQNGKLAESIEAYGKVRAGGPHWLEALEERATAMLRQGRVEEALASLKTVLTPLFEDRIFSEPFFLAAFAQMRICDYKSVFKTIDLFKDRYREKVKSWEAGNDKLARLRLKEVRETIDKLNLVEAETIQHLYVGEAGKPQAGSPPAIQRAADQLTFPTNHEIDSKEVWLDEVDSFRVTAKGCPTSTEAIPVARKE